MKNTSTSPSTVPDGLLIVTEVAPANVTGVAVARTVGAAMYTL